MSTYLEDSELMAFNRYPLERPFFPSEDLFYLTQLAKQLYLKSAGQYDVTVGLLGNLWGFGASNQGSVIPSATAIAATRARVGMKWLEIDTAQQTLTRHADLFVDLSSLAKGYAVDKIAKLFEAWGIENYLVEIGGEIRMKGVKPNGSPWRIGIEAPLPDRRVAQRVITANDRGIATSGDYRNFIEVDGEQFSHVIDPHSGQPVSHRLASVTVIADSCVKADALSTMLMVLGEDKGTNLARESDISALFIVKEKDGFEIKMTGGFERYLVH
jgi:thiamine biosynthesis lipoprotein